VHFHAVGPGLLAPLPRYLSGARVVQTVHGFDADRAKWGATARRVLQVAQHMSARVPDATITVSRFLQDEYRRRYRRETIFIPHGVIQPEPRPAHEIMQRYDLRPGGYVLFVGRLVPEKAVHLLIGAFRQLRSDLRLVIVGGAASTPGYAQKLRSMANGDARILLTGSLYGPLVEELYENAAVFVSPSLLEGSPLTLLEAASRGIPLVVSDISAQRELSRSERPGYRLAAAGDENELAAALRRALADPVAERAGAERLQQLVLERYSWDEAARATADVYERVLAPSHV